MIDANTNQLSIRNVIESVEVRVEADGPPPQPFVTQVNWSVVSMWTRTDPDKPEKDAKGRITIISPAGQPLGGGEFTLDLQKSRGVRAISQIALFAVLKSGIYHLVVAEPAAAGAWKDVARLPIDVTVMVNSAKLL